MPKRLPPHRSLFHFVGGGVDFARIIEQTLPLLVVSAISSGIVVYANSGISAAQLGSLREQVNRSDAARETAQKDTQKEIQVILVELAKSQAIMASALSQQTLLNAQMDARLIYVERAQASRVTVIEQQRPAARSAK